MTLKEILDIESQNSEQMDSKPTIKRERNKVDKIERENIFHPNNLYYNSAGDYYICPMGQKMQRCGTAKSVSDLGYVTHLARYRSMRPIEPEAVFGQIKSGHLFRRFALRSLEKVNVEFGLIAIAHNLKKWAVAMFTRVDRTAAKTLKKMELYLNFTLVGEPEFENLKIAA